MAIIYGVLRGRPDRYKREDNASTPHLQIRVLEDTGQPWRIAVNVQSDTGSDVAFWVVDPLAGHPLLASLSAQASGFSTVARNADHALDYVKAPLFDWKLGRLLPPSGNASSDDLQDLLSLHLDQCKNAGGELYAFGAKFDRNLHKPIDIEFGNTDGLHGIHDIHLNQGNVGAHSQDNGALHDGGLLLAFPDRYLGLFLGFQTQRIPTDAAGNAAPGASAIARSSPDVHRLRRPDPRSTSNVPSSTRAERTRAARSWFWPASPRPRRRSPIGAWSTRMPGSRRSTPRSSPGNPCSSRSMATVSSSGTREAT